ncbi:CAP domain-containing protein [Albirhodobacter sp. R86504]|jgi:uncharacterized protein YkwD|uniref:CAP domain-containing protein n=1 Tax=Albirhodobacter sp. R86504 TaxID=3093848 RepID=UPI00366FE99C
MLKLTCAAFIAIFVAGAAQSASCDLSTQMAAAMAQEVNQQRAAQGLRPLQTDSKLTAAAQAHGCDMARRGYFSHTGADGSSAGARVKKTGYRACLSAENISYGWPDTGRAMQDLMNSKGHRANILHKKARALGVAVIPKQGTAGPWYVQVFAAPC